MVAVSLAEITEIDRSLISITETGASASIKYEGDKQHGEAPVAFYVALVLTRPVCLKTDVDMEVENHSK